MSRKQVIRTTIQFRHGGIHDVNPQLIVKRYKDIFVIDWAIICFFAEAVCRTDNLPMSHPTAGKESARNAWPVIAACILVDFWCSSKVAPDDNRDIFVQPAFVKIKFDTASVAYRETLASAVSTARRRKPDAVFDVVGVSAGRSVVPEATANATDVVNTLTSLGVDPVKIRVFNSSSPTINSHEVRIYVR